MWLHRYCGRGSPTPLGDKGLNAVRAERTRSHYGRSFVVSQVPTMCRATREARALQGCRSALRSGRSRIARVGARWWHVPVNVSVRRTHRNVRDGLKDRGAPRIHAGPFPDSLSEAAGRWDGARCCRRPFRHSNDYFPNTATKGSLGGSPNMVRTFQPVPRTS